MSDRVPTRSDIDAMRSDSPAAAEMLERLAAAAQHGEPDALQLLLYAIDRHRLADPAIRRVLIAEHDVADAAQDVLIAVANSIGDFQGRAKFTTWLHTVARHKAIEVIRRREAGVATVADPQIDGVGDRTRMSSLIATDAAVQQLLQRLPEPYRAAVRRRDLDGLSYAEVAADLGLNLNTARSHIARGRALLATYVAS